ncbi:hypothetical protein LEP1GSC193_3161 [Leptospira alstonii serovar Pingchang str. 80-412]|uniref:Uncharacterized protein n=2 Tax=Leptospira alstonii TaxID=28452 RepID=M6D0I8_9LEPT|nr:hypothetical protein LEP1GSC194_2941 [Leptospira alstonii serovar Sichuan str. 79601]EQA79400.1 hypothetical protein LEP1GSC193_3161 [Leptospira alstonii serovar Pingchang str. 80-412]
MASDRKDPEMKIQVKNKMIGTLAPKFAERFIKAPKMRELLRR